MKAVIVGGVAAGASTAARIRRLSEDAEIVMLERGDFVSFANCGLPYHLSHVIEDRSDLLVMTPEKLYSRFRIDARVQQEVQSIDRQHKTVTVKDGRSGKLYTEDYDKLVLATGSSPVHPPIPGADDPDVMQLWTIPDMDRIHARLKENAQRATVVGGGFIGLEVAENLREAGLDVTLVEMMPQVFPAVDPEMATALSQELTANGVHVKLKRKVTRIHRESNSTEAADELTLTLDDGTEVTTDLVVMAVGVRPNAELAEQAELEIGSGKAVRVNEHMQTSDPDIYAAGDVVETRHMVLDTPMQVPLAGPANRQGRVVADNICGRSSTYQGALGTSIVKLFNKAGAAVGANEHMLQQHSMPYHRIMVHPSSHAGYYPNASVLSIKLLFSPEGRVLGAQAVGEEGVDKRIDVIATTMRLGGTVYDLEELELAYAPPFGSARDPVNYAGMTASNVLKGDTSPIYPDALPEDACLLDVRFPEEQKSDPGVENATIIPLPELRDRVSEVPRDKEVVVYCAVGLRAYMAERILRQAGFRTHNLSGGLKTYRMVYPRNP